MSASHKSKTDTSATQTLHDILVQLNGKTAEIITK